jgi:hypothetical protein
MLMYLLVTIFFHFLLPFSQETNSFFLTQETKDHQVLNLVNLILFTIVHFTRFCANGLFVVYELRMFVFVGFHIAFDSVCLLLRIEN